MTPTLSITLPSLFPVALARALANIRDATRANYEVIVVSPKPPPREFKNIIWIEEVEGTGTGCAAAHYDAGQVASGEFITPFADDHLYTDGWDVGALKNYERRETRFHGKNPGKPFILGLRHVDPAHVGTEMGLYYAYFPFMRRFYIERISYYDCAYRSGFSDSDLSFRCWNAGGRCEWSERGLIVAHPDDNRKTGALFTDADMKLFVRRWGRKYGKGWGFERIRQFNLDINPKTWPQYIDAEGFSVTYGRPDFKDTVFPWG